MNINQIMINVNYVKSYIRFKLLKESIRMYRLVSNFELTVDLFYIKSIYFRQWTEDQNVPLNNLILIQSFKLRPIIDFFIL
jgi:hypothetical protein